MLGHWAQATPDAPALLAPGRPPLTYAALYEQTRAVAAQLRSIGIGPDDRVAIVHANGPELAAAFLAVSSVAVSAPLNPAYRMSELDLYLCRSPGEGDARRPGDVTSCACSRTAAWFDWSRSSADASGGAGAVSLSAGRVGRRARPTPGETALVLHTSGTTSRPKLVPLTHRALCLSARNVAETLALRGEDRCLNVMPLFHMHGLVGALLSSLSAGAGVICAPSFHAPSFHDVAVGARADVVHGRADDAPGGARTGVIRRRHGYDASVHQIFFGPAAGAACTRGWSGRSASPSSRRTA